MVLTQRKLPGMAEGNHGNGIAIITCAFLKGKIFMSHFPFQYDLIHCHQFM